MFLFTLCFWRKNFQVLLKQIDINHKNPQKLHKLYIKNDIIPVKTLVLVSQKIFQDTYSC